MAPKEESKQQADKDEERQPVLVSACLLGRECRYDGRHNRDSALERELGEQGLRAVPFCPEEHGGLGTPRPAAWIEARSAEHVLSGESRVVSKDGRDVTAEFVRGAEGALETCKTYAIRLALLKERSPSCGVAQTHVAGVAVDGPGVTAALLARHGIEVRGVEGRRA
jgi:uncharacterized protein YbbK (DUF523 family)